MALQTVDVDVKLYDMRWTEELCVRLASNTYEVESTSTVVKCST
jgi:hypothetical protein